MSGTTQWCQNSQQEATDSATVCKQSAAGLWCPSRQNNYARWILYQPSGKWSFLKCEHCGKTKDINTLTKVCKRDEYFTFLKHKTRFLLSFMRRFLCPWMHVEFLHMTNTPLCARCCWGARCAALWRPCTGVSSSPRGSWSEHWAWGSQERARRKIWSKPENKPDETRWLLKVKTWPASRHKLEA